MNKPFKTRLSIFGIPFPVLFRISVLFFIFSSNLLAADGPRTLLIKGDNNYPPFEYLNERNLPDGFNVEIMRAVAEKMGLKISIQLDSWEKVRSQLENGEIDALMGMFKTREREKLVDFSIPHFIASYAVFVPRGSKIKSLEDAQNMTIIVQKGDLSHDYVVENKITDKLISKETPLDALKSLSSGTGDCALLSRLQGMILIKTNKIKNIAAAGPPILQRKYCIAVTRGNGELLAKLNEGLSIIKTSGEYDRIYDKWFGPYIQPGWTLRKVIKYASLVITPLVLILFFTFLWNRALKKQVLAKTKKLYESREDLKITLNSIGDAVIATDINTRITLMNPIAEELTGWTMDEAKGKPLDEVFPIINAVTLIKVDNPVKKVLEKGKIIGLANHTLLLSRNGKKYHIADSAAPIQDARNEISGVIMVFRNVTREYKLQEELKKSQNQFKAFMDSFPGCAFIKDENLNLIFANSFMEKKFNARKWTGKHPSQLFPKETAEIIIAHDKKALSQGSCQIEEGLTDKDGNTGHYLTRKFSIPLPDGTKLLGGIALDITERKMTEEALRRSENKYRRLINTTSEGFWLIDSEHKTIDMNQALCNMLGYSREEMMGRSPLDFVAAENHTIFKQQFNKAGTTLHRTYEVSLIKKNGSRFPALFNATTVTDTKEMGSFAFVTDITQQKIAEKELEKIEKLKSIGTLAGGIAHDFNNILMGLYGNIALAREELSREHPAFKALKEAENSMNRAVRLTNQLLTFSKGGNPVKEDINMGSLVKETIDFDLSGSAVQPLFDLPGDLRPVKADKGQLQQVFSNLAINAVQAMPDGGTLSVTLKNMDVTPQAIPGPRPGRYVKVIIKDEGIGIDPDHLDRIFDPYFTTKQKGSGLGLATVHSIIHKHDGWVGVESKPGSGTIFTLYIPAADAPLPRKTDEVETPRPGEKMSARILIMDDEEAICDVVTSMLDKIGFSAGSAPGGKEAVEMYRQAMDDGDPFDLVIMDLTIPGGVGGKEAVKDILALDPLARVVVSSGYADDPVMANYADYGFKGIMEKPYTMNCLNKTLTRVLNG